MTREADILAQVRKAAQYGTIKLSRHAEDEADNANAQAADIKHAILSATSAVEQEEEKIRLDGGTDLDGHPLVVVVVVVTHHGLRVVTVF